MNRMRNLFVAAGLAVVILGGNALGQCADCSKDKEGKEGKEGKSELRGGGHGMMGGGGMMNMMCTRLTSDPKLAEELGVTEVQIKTIKDAGDASKAAMETTKKQLTDLEQQMKTMLEGENVDEAAVLALVDKIAPLKLEMEKSMIKTSLLVKKTLTAEQMTKIKDKMHQQRKGMRGEGDKGGKGCEHGSKTDAPAKTE